MSLRHHYWTEAEYQQVVKNWAKGRVEGHSPAPLGPPREWKARHPIPADSKASVVAQPVSSPAPSPVFQRVFIPGPLPGMNDIVRKNYYVYSAMKKQWSRTIGQCIILAKLQPMQRAAVSFTWMERNTRRDPDNIIAGGQKLVLDCLVTAGILPDDGWDEIAALVHGFNVDASNPGVWVMLDEVSI